MEVKSLLIKIGTDVAAMEAGFKKADGLIVKNAEKFKKAGRAMTIAGGVIVGVVGGLVKAYADFDNQLTESTAIMGDVSDAMRNKMAGAAKEMSEHSTFSAAQLAEAYYFLASAGMDAEQSIAALPAVCAFAQAGAFDLATATDLLTDAQSALGLSSKDVVENQENMVMVSDALVKGASLANASVKQFSEALTNRAGPSMRGYGIEVNAGVAVLAAFADQGIKGKQAGEKYSIVLRDMQKAALDNKEAFKKAGVAVYDANLNLNNMGDIVGELEDYMGSMTAGQKKSTLTMLGFQEESQGVMLTLMGTSDKIKEYEKALGSAGGVTRTVANKQLKSLTAQFTMAKNSIMNTAISLGETLGPMMVEIAGKIKETAQRIRNWIKEHPELTKGIALATAKVGILLTVLGPLVIMLPKIAAGLKLVKVAFIALQSPVGLIGIAVLAIVVSLKDMIKTMNDAKKDMADFATESEVFTNAAENFRTLWITVREEGGANLEQFNELMTRFGGNWDAVMKTIIKDAKFATLKARLMDVASGVTKVDLAGQELSITLPASFLKAGEGAGTLVKEIFAANEKIVGLVRTMTDEIKKSGEDEYQTAKRHLAEKLADRIASIQAEQTVEQGNAAAAEALEIEKNAAIATARAAFRTEDAALAKAHVDAIVERAKEEAEKKGEIDLDAAIQKKELRDALFAEQTAWYAANYSEYEALVDSLNQLEMGKFQYANWLLDQKYAKEMATSTNLILLEEEYLAQKKALADAAREEEDAARKQSLENTLADIAMTLNAIGGLFQMSYQNNMIRIDNEEKRRMEAIDNQYNAQIEALTAIEKAEKKKTTEVLDAINREYDDKKQHILDNMEDNEKRDAMLEALELEREDRLDYARVNREVAEAEAAQAVIDIEEAKNEAIRIASEDLEGKRAAARRTAAKQEKAVALLSAIVNTAAAVTKALPNLFLAAAVGALGAIQIAMIASKPIPLKAGGIVTSRTIAEIGEAGPEAVIPLNKLGGFSAQPAPVHVKQTNYFYGDINNVGDLDEISDRLARRMTRQLERGRRS